MIAGIDACPAGWIAAVGNAQANNASGLCLVLYSNIHDFWLCYGERLTCCLIDIPIGLGSADAPVREFDRSARAVLRGRLSSRVFSPPVREAIDCGSYREACALSRRLTGKAFSKQAWNICPKIREVDRFLALQPQAQSILLEGHPELAFSYLNNGQPVLPSKKTSAGREIRRALLEAHLPSFTTTYAGALLKFPRRQVARDDLLDAAALLAQQIRVAAS